MNIDRRTFTGGLAFALGAPFARAQSPAFAALHAKAREEGEITWYIAHYRSQTAEAIGKRFTEAFPGVKVNVVRATGQTIFQRLMQDMKVGSANCDVFSSSDGSHYLALKKRKALAAYTPVNLAECLPVVRQAADPEHFFTATDASMSVLVYGTKTVSEAEAPKRWTDLIDPKWKNQVALPHPGYSGAMGAWVVAMDRMYGWTFFEKLAANKPHIGRSQADPPTTIGSGERKIGIGPASLVVGQGARGLPVAPVLPEDGVQLGFAPSGVMANSSRPNAARLFMEFLLSKECGELLAAEYSIPIRPDVKPLPGVVAAGSVKGFRSSPLEVEAKLPGLVEKWRDTFGV